MAEGKQALTTLEGEHKGASKMRFERVLVALDGSEFAAHALEVAGSLATALSAQIGLVHVIDVKLVAGETGVRCPVVAVRLPSRRGEGR